MLEEFGLFESSADSDLAWEVPHIAGEFLRHLSMRQRLAAPGLLAPIIAEIALLTEELRQSVVATDIDRIRLASDNIKQVLDAARSLSRENYRAILHEVMRIKSRQDNRTLRERFLFISQLHERHLAPLGGLVDVGGEMESRAAELIAVARTSRDSMANDPFVPEIAAKIVSLVRRMKDEAWEDFHSALREVTPLFHQIRRDHALATSVSNLLENLRRHGAKALDDIAVRLQIARWRADNVFSRFAIDDYLAGVERHVSRPEQGPILTSDDHGDTPLALHTMDVSAQLDADGEQPDLLKWLIGRYSEFPDQQILQAFHWIADNPLFVAQPGEVHEFLETTEARYTYHPMRISTNA
ncbi:MAG: hypothetical protein WCA45_13720 [Thiobacillaceae bacterium]